MMSKTEIETLLQEAEHDENILLLLYSQKQSKRNKLNVEEDEEKWQQIQKDINLKSEQAKRNFKIDYCKYKKLVFRETLLIGKVYETLPLGAICIDIQGEHGKRKNKFLVHVSSKFSHDGQPCGSTITAWVDELFNTIEERRFEFLSDNCERTLYTAQKHHYYHVYTADHPHPVHLLSCQVGLMTEGANMVLMRYLAIILYIGQFEYKTLDIEGTLCRNIYKCHGPHSQKINGKSIDLCSITRIILKNYRKPSISVTILTLQGQIIEQRWNDCPYYLCINPLAIVENLQPCGSNLHIPLSAIWQDDFELAVRYLDRKNWTNLTMRSYLNDHPEITEVISDFLTHLLHTKPTDDNVLMEAYDFFTRFE